MTGMGGAFLRRDEGFFPALTSLSEAHPFAVSRGLNAVSAYAAIPCQGSRLREQHIG